MSDRLSIPRDIEPVAPSLLALAVQRGSTEATGRGSMAPIPAIPGTGFWVELGPGKGAKFYQITDHPMNRFMKAVSDLSPFDQGKAFSLCTRSMVAVDAIKDRRFKRYVREVEGSPALIDTHEVVFEAVAEMPMDRKSLPSPQDVLREVKRRESAQGDLGL